MISFSSKLFKTLFIVKLSFINCNTLCLSHFNLQMQFVYKM